VKRIFINVHPDEMGSERFQRSLSELPRRLGPDLKPVLEIHEVAVTDGKAMAAMHARLRELGIELAYDDFGAGQSRLLELAESPPDFIKLDMGFVRDIHLFRPRQELMRALLGVMSGLGVSVIAEGIEQQAEYHACLELGCEYGQGFFIQEPVSADRLLR
jgi:EAL domain-containing protein (putative c-di-GMP-specific phosphodiesterase class I)